MTTHPIKRITFAHVYLQLQKWNSNSSSLQDGDINVLKGEREVVHDEAESTLGIDEFGMNANIVRSRDLEVSAKDFEVVI